MVKVKLLGEMGEKFGTDWVSADNNMRDIFKLIEAQTEGFADYIKDLMEKDNVGLEIIHGDKLLIQMIMIKINIKQMKMIEQICFSL